VLLGNGDGTFRASVPYAVGSGPGVVVAADFNGDGHIDLAVENVGTHDVSVLLGNGDGTFRPPVRYPAGMSPGGLAVADFNGDGKPDLVVANHNSSNVSVLLGNGDGTFRPAEHYAAGWTPAGVAVGDFNGDGRLDVAVVNHRSDNVSVLLNQPPAPHFRLTAKLEVSLGEPSEVGVAAMDADNNADSRYRGTVRVTSSDPRAEFRVTDYTFRAEESGVGSVGVELRTTGAQTITISDTVTRSRVGTITIPVTAWPATHLSVIAPALSKPGQGIRIAIVPRDNFETRAEDYRGTVRVTSSDPRTVLPKDYRFVQADSGVRWLPVTLRTPGVQTITVTDTATGTIVGRAKVHVQPSSGKRAQ
jgi:hypothetical protein